MTLFQKRSFLKKPSYKKTSQIIIRFLKVQNEWVVFKNDRLFPKTRRSFLKKIEKRNKKQSFNDRFQKRLTTLFTILNKSITNKLKIQGVPRNMTVGE